MKTSMTSEREHRVDTVQGIIAEYNPFHNGHLYQLQSSAAATGASHTVCVMSGAFVQRGEPACFHKQARTEMALAAGVDIVLELPAAFACASAEAFAAGAVSTLEATGIVDWLCFGSETGDLTPLRTLADVLADEPDAFRKALKLDLDEGLSFAAAREKALRTYLAQSGGTVDALRSPNNILAVEYLKALNRQHARMKPHTIARRGRGYNDPILDGRYPSATAIRLALSNSGSDASHLLRDGVPESTLRVMTRETSLGRGPVMPDDFLPMLLHRLRTSRREELARLPYLEPGMVERLVQAASDACSYSDLIGKAATSRYPRTRIQRILSALLVGMTSDLEQQCRDAGYAQYIRIAGFSERARPLLAAMRRNASLPILGKSSQWGIHHHPLIHDLLALEARASDTWALACRNPADRRAGSESRQSPVRLPAST